MTRNEFKQGLQNLDVDTFQKNLLYAYSRIDDGVFCQELVDRIDDYDALANSAVIINRMGQLGQFTPHEASSISRGALITFYALTAPETGTELLDELRDLDPYTITMGMAHVLMKQKDKKELMAMRTGLAKQYPAFYAATFTAATHNIATNSTLRESAMFVKGTRAAGLVLKHHIDVADMNSLIGIEEEEDYSDI